MAKSGGQMATEVHEGSGNVFADLGLPQPKDRQGGQTTHMAQIEIIPRRRASQVFEGTPDEIVERLRGLNGATKLTLIIPGEELPPTQIAAQEQEPIKTEMTFAQILAPAEQDFIASGMSEAELDDFIEAEVKAYRAEKQAKGNAANG